MNLYWSDIWSAFIKVLAKVIDQRKSKQEDVFQSVLK